MSSGTGTNVGDVIILAPCTLYEMEPEGWITATTLYLDRDFLVDQVFCQYASAFSDRLDAQRFVEAHFADPAQVLRLRPDRAGLAIHCATNRAAASSVCPGARRGAPRRPWTCLNEEQDRISRRLAFLDSRIDAGQIEYDQAKAHLQDCLALAGNAHAIYMSLDDSLRRICNQAFFERIKSYEVDGADTVEAEPGEPFDAELHAEALAYDAALQAGSDAQPAHVAGLNIQHWVGPTGIEPMTSTV